MQREPMVDRLELRLRYQHWTADSTVGTNVDLLVGGVPITDFGRYAINFPFGLVPTIEYDGEFWPLTCTCGDEGCAGIWKPTTVRHDGHLVRWHLGDPEPHRQITFDEQQYSDEIRRLVEEATRLVADGRLTDAVPYFNQLFFAREETLDEDLRDYGRRQLELGIWRIRRT